MVATSDDYSLRSMEVTDILQQTWRVECMGCAISSGAMQPPGGMIAANASCYMHQDPEVPLPGFLILGTTRHIQSLSELEVEEYHNVATLLYASRRALRLLPDIISVTLIQEERSSHFHLWLFPWYQWMIDQYGSISLSHIRPIMNALKQESSSQKALHHILAWVERLRAEIAQQEED